MLSRFYEWQPVEGQKAKQPWYIRLAKQKVFAMAGLWDRSVNDDGEAIYSATIITVPANDLLAEIHKPKKRMPLIIDRDVFDTWLDGGNDDAERLITAYPAAKMEAWPVSRRVNSARNDDADLLERLT